MWTLVLIVLSAIHQHEYVILDDVDEIACVEQGQTMKREVPDLVWLCIGPNREVRHD